MSRYRSHYTKQEIADEMEAIRSMEWRSMELPSVDTWATDEGKPHLVIRFHRPSYSEIAPVVRTPPGVLWAQEVRPKKRFGDCDDDAEFGVETKRKKERLQLHGELHCHPSHDRAELEVSTGHVIRYRKRIRVKLR